MTRPSDFGGGTEFSDWLRDQPELDSRRYHLSLQNVDFTVHRYGVKRQGQIIQAVMLLEEKRYMGKSQFAQRDTHKIIDQALRLAHGQSVINERGDCTPFHYFGYHVLQFENTSPADGKMFWDGERIEIADLIRLLRFEDVRLNLQSHKNI